MWSKGEGYDKNHEHNAWDSHSDAKGRLSSQIWMLMLMIIELITNEENEEARDSFPDVSPGKVCIPWKLLHLLGTRSERKTELCVSKHLKIFSFGGK